MRALKQTLCMILGMILYFPIYFFIIPIFTEDILLKKLFPDMAYVFISPLYTVYYVYGLLVFLLLVWLYSKNGLFPDYIENEPGIKCNLPKKVKHFITGIAFVLLLLCSILPCTWYTLFTEENITAHHFGREKIYEFLDVEYYTLDTALMDDTMDYIVVMKDGKNFSLYNAMCILSDLPEETYPNGVDDYCIYLTEKFSALNIPLKIDDWDAFYDELGYEYWKDVADEVRSKAI